MHGEGGWFTVLFFASLAFIAFLCFGIRGQQIRHLGEEGDIGSQVCLISAALREEVVFGRQSFGEAAWILIMRSTRIWKYSDRNVDPAWKGITSQPE